MQRIRYFEVEDGLFESMRYIKSNIGDLKVQYDKDDLAFAIYKGKEVVAVGKAGSLHDLKIAIKSKLSEYGVKFEQEARARLPKPI